LIDLQYNESYLENTLTRYIQVFLKNLLEWLIVK